MSVLIAAVGYRNLRDMSVAHEVMPALQQLPWSCEVDFDDLSFGPIAVVQRFQDRPGCYERVVFVSANERGREPGRVYSYRWSGKLPAPDEIQARVAEAVGGVVSLDNLLIIAGYFGALPADVRIVEVEPVDTNWGEGFSSAVEGKLAALVQAVRKAATDP